MAKRSGVTFETARRLLVAFPGVEEGPCYGTPGFRVRGKFLARLRDDGGTLVVKCGDDERDFRMKADPHTFFTTDHYRGYPTVLVRLASVTPGDLHDVLEQAWRRSAPKRLIAAYDHKSAGQGRAFHNDARRVTSRVID
jgi:hypothetical protein